MNWYDNILNDVIDENEELAFEIAYDFASYLDKRQIDYIEFAKQIDMNVKEIKSILIGNKIPESSFLETIEYKANTKIFRYLDKKINIPFNSVCNLSNSPINFPKIQSGSLPILPITQSPNMKIAPIGRAKSRDQYSYITSIERFEGHYVR